MEPRTGRMSEKQVLISKLIDAIARAYFDRKDSVELLDAMLVAGNFQKDPDTVQKLLRFIQANLEGSGKSVDACREYLQVNGVEPLSVQQRYQNVIEEIEAENLKIDIARRLTL